MIGQHPGQYPSKYRGNRQALSALVRETEVHRDLYLDRSRAIYEMEVKTDLGDAMVRLSEAQLADARNRFARALAWERLKVLTGGPAVAKETGQSGLGRGSDDEKAQ